MRIVTAGKGRRSNPRERYRLRFVQNGAIWKLFGINVDARKL
jgi:hypothetical protein